MPDESDAASIRINYILTRVRGGGVERQVGLEGSLKSFHLVGYNFETAKQHPGTQLNFIHLERIYVQFSNSSFNIDYLSDDEQSLTTVSALLGDLLHLLHFFAIKES